MQDRIKKIEKYFRGFEISNDIVYIILDFPKKWQIPSAELLDEMFKVKAVNANNNDFLYFCSEINDGIYLVFDAAEFTINFNLTLEEKSQLLIQKVNELKELFAEKPIEVLKTIEFKYKEKNNKKNKIAKKEELETQVTSSNTDNTTTYNNAEETNVEETENTNNNLVDFIQEEY